MLVLIEMLLSMHPAMPVLHCAGQETPIINGLRNVLRGAMLVNVHQICQGVKVERPEELIFDGADKRGAETENPSCRSRIAAERITAIALGAL